MAAGTDVMYRVVQVATGVAGSPYYLTAYFNATTGTAQAAADAWRACIGPAAITFITPYQYLAITDVDKVDPTTGDIVDVVTVNVPALAFTASEDPLPPATTILLRWRTGVYQGGKEIRGRTNISRLGESASTAGVVTAASVTAWQTRCTALVTDANSEHVVWSPKNGMWATTVSGSPWSQFAVLRSRRD